ncbi:MAG: hypothetical protein Q4C70_12970, partial [Planctomycetia bacterium]|nr:hypothetical protein [Planctomycetia bacterium]
APAQPATQPVAEKKTYKTLEVKSSPLKVNVETTAIIWPEELQVVRLTPETWAKFIVESVAEHGQRVKKGDVILRFKKEDYDRHVKDTALEVEVAEAAYQRSLNLRKVADVNFAITKKNAEWRKFFKLKAWDVNSTKDIEHNTQAIFLNMDSSIQAYENQKAELEQLSRMYEAEELTEQSEEIVLKRQRLALKNAELELERAKARFEWKKEMIIPRMKEELKDTFDSEMAQIEADNANLKYTERTIAAERKQADIAHQKTLKKWNDLKADEKWFEIKAECDGIVLYGAMENGAWSNYTKSAQLLVPGTEVTLKTSVMSVVNTEKMYLKFTVAEGSYAKLMPRQNGYFIANSWPDVEIPTQITELGNVLVGTEYPGTASMELEPGLNLVPGLKGKMTVAAVRKSNAIMIPATAMDRDDQLKRFVYVMEENKDTPTRRMVKVGIKQGTQVEILDGLAAGMKIVEDPKTVE